MPATTGDRLVASEDERRARLSPAKQALLRRLEAGGAIGAASPAPVRAEADVLVTLKAGGDRTPLYCVHPISGSAYAYVQLSRSLASDQPVYAFEAPGFDNARQPVASVEGLSAEYVEAIQRQGFAGAGCLLGWSMGGIVAFDMARRIAASGSDVPHLIMVDAPAPQPVLMPADRDLLARFICDLLGITGGTPSPVDPILARWRETDGFGPAFREIEQAGVLPPELDASSLRRRFAVFRANVEAICGYQPEYTHRGPLTLIRASGSPREFMRWDRQASEVEEHTVAGDHYSMWTGRGLAMLGDIVQQCLDHARRRGSDTGVRVSGP
jgi:thioesterase domain-containing protein